MDKVMGIKMGIVSLEMFLEAIQTETMQNTLNEGCARCPHKVSEKIPGMEITVDKNIVKDVQWYVKCKFVDDGKVKVKPIATYISQKDCPRIRRYECKTDGLRNKPKFLRPTKDERQQSVSA